MFHQLCSLLLQAFFVFSFPQTQIVGGRNFSHGVKDLRGALPIKVASGEKKIKNKQLAWGLGSQGRCGGESNRGGEGRTRKVRGDPIPGYAGGSFEHEIYADLFCDVM